MPRLELTDPVVRRAAIEPASASPSSSASASGNLELVHDIIDGIAHGDHRARSVPSSATSLLPTRVIRRPCNSKTSGPPAGARGMASDTRATPRRPLAARAAR